MVKSTAATNIGDYDRARAEFSWDQARRPWTDRIAMGFELARNCGVSYSASHARLGAAVAPKEFASVPPEPKTQSGKILRRLLKGRESGLPEGDTSTLEGN